MNRHLRTAIFTLGSTLVFCGVILSQQIGERPAISKHMSQSDIDGGRVSFQEVIEHGRQLFTTVFNRLDGQGLLNRNHC